MASICAAASPLKCLSAALATTRSGAAGTGESFSELPDERFGDELMDASAPALVLDVAAAEANCIFGAVGLALLVAAEAEREAGAKRRAESLGSFSARKSESTRSSGASRVAFTRRKRPSSRCKR